MASLSRRRHSHGLRHHGSQKLGVLHLDETPHSSTSSMVRIPLFVRLPHRISTPTTRGKTGCTHSTTRCLPTREKRSIRNREPAEPPNNHSRRQTPRIGHRSQCSLTSHYRHSPPGFQRHSRTNPRRHSRRRIRSTNSRTPRRHQRWVNNSSHLLLPRRRSHTTPSQRTNLRPGLSRHSTRGTARIARPPPGGPPRNPQDSLPYHAEILLAGIDENSQNLCTILRHMFSS